MPSNKFYNLNINKKKQIITAAKKEFSTHKYEDASINKIIQSIDMPRGSFYLYFDNKQDLYFYILKDYIRGFKLNLIKILKNNNNDLFQSMISFYDLIVNNEDENCNLVTNMLTNINQEQLDTVLPQFMKEEMDGSVIRNINISNYNITSNEIEILLSIILPLFFFAIAKALKEKDKKNIIRVHYLSQLNIIKRGLERKTIC